jgi:predicted O-methyltransferase YrrM
MIEEIFQNSEIGVNEIKLKTLLSQLEKNKMSPVIHSLMPPVGIGSVTLVDQIVLLSLAKLISAQRIVEIGTYLGYSTALFALNTTAQIFSIDLPKMEQKRIGYEEELVLIDGNYNDDFLRSEQNDKGEIYLDYLNVDERKKITLVKADSTSINFQEKFGFVDLVFIDGGHERSIVEKDTINARSIVKNGVIIWHDFGSKIHNDVSSFLLGEKDRKIFHVLGSLCAFELISSEGRVYGK